MHKQQLHDLLYTNHTAFIQLMQGMNESNFVKKVADKWTPAQQAKHIHQSVHPVNLAFRLPNFLLNLVFGKANRPSKTYQQLIDKYKSKLAAGGKAPARFIPKAIPYLEKEKLIKQLQKDIAILCRLTLQKNETDLDTYILPHPLLGKITLREMLYFTCYHVTHHQQLVQQIINS